MGECGLGGLFVGGGVFVGEGLWSCEVVLGGCNALCDTRDTTRYHEIPSVMMPYGTGVFVEK